MRPLLLLFLQRKKWRTEGAGRTEQAQRHRMGRIGVHAKGWQRWFRKNHRRMSHCPV